MRFIEKLAANTLLSASMAAAGINTLELLNTLYDAKHGMNPRQISALNEPVLNEPNKTLYKAISWIGEPGRMLAYSLVEEQPKRISQHTHY
ncbi:MAG: hypothetical protein HY513_02060 [Candidatus Aenigmarchaeota archaeon]|nr:hypothetical protein [Candidatus Aenigmarchaeota archaeon]